MRNFWQRHAWSGEPRRYHWLVTFDHDAAVARCAAAHAPVLARHRGVVDPVPAAWLHLTLQPLCPVGHVDTGELDSLAHAAGRELAAQSPVRVQLGPARIDGAAVTLAVHPEEELATVQHRVAHASRRVLGEQRAPARRSRWWPHVTLAYGAVENDPADDLAAELARTPLPRVEVTIRAVALVDQVQDLHRREYRWRTVATVPLGGG